MSRFDYYDDCEEGLPYGLWDTVVSNALGGRRGQEALADLEAALIALPEQKLVYGHLAAEGQVCAIGALVAYRRAQRQGVDIATVIDAMSAGVQCGCGHARDAHPDGGHCTGKVGWPPSEKVPCRCDGYAVEEDEDPEETTQAGQRVGLKYSVAWHLANLNDRKFGSLEPEERYQKMLAWVRRAQGKEAVA